MNIDDDYTNIYLTSHLVGIIDKHIHMTSKYIPYYIKYLK